MNLAITEFLKQTEAIKIHNECFESFERLLKAHKKTEPDARKIANNFTAERIFNYRANIISLYGCFEHFIEALIKEYIGDLSQICKSFDKLDKKIRRGYVVNWKTLHGKLSFPKYSDISEKEMIESLYLSIVEGHNKIMEECYLKNGGNYNHRMVMDSFCELGLDNLDTILGKYHPLNEFLQQEGLQDMESESKYRMLNSLVQYRNNIAHGVDPDNILSVHEFTDYLDFLEKYAKAVALYVNDSYWGKYWEIKAKDKVLKPDKVYPKIGVAEFTIANVILYQGQKIIMKQAEGNYPRYKDFVLPNIFKVKKTDWDNSKITDVKELCEDGIWKVSIKIDIKCNDRCRFYFCD